MREITLYPGESLVLADGTRVVAVRPPPPDHDPEAMAVVLPREFEISPLDLSPFSHP